MELARLAVEETGRGILEDKVTKNIFATEYVYHSIKYDKTVGVIEDNSEEDFMLVAEPVGIVCGSVTTVTNRTSTTMFKSSSPSKPATLSFSHSTLQLKNALGSSTHRTRCRVAAGAPEDCVMVGRVPFY